MNNPMFAHSGSFAAVMKLEQTKKSDEIDLCDFYDSSERFAQSCHYEMDEEPLHKSPPPKTSSASDADTAASRRRAMGRVASLFRRRSLRTQSA